MQHVQRGDIVAQDAKRCGLSQTGHEKIRPKPRIGTQNRTGEIELSLTSPSAEGFSDRDHGFFLDGKGNEPTLHPK